MPVVNDVQGAWEAIRAEGERLGKLIGIQPEVLWGFFNSFGRFPQSIPELEAWGNDPSNNQYNYRRRQANGVWTPLGPGDTPGTMGAKDPGFKHVITNPEDYDVQRFKDFDPGIIARFGQQTVAPAPAGSRSATAGAMSVNPYPVGSPYHDTWEQGNPSDRPFDPNTPPSTGGGVPPPAGSPAAGPPAAGTAPAAGTGAGGTSSGLAPLIDAAAYGNTQTLQAQIDDAVRRYALARTTEERNQAYLDLQRWQTELKKAETQQQRYDAMAQSILAASVNLKNNPRDWVKFNQYTSGGRDIFAQMQQAGPAFSGPTGPIEPGSVNDLLSRLGIQPSQPTPATPAGVLPGAANPHNPELPAIPIPGTPGGPPAALQPGAGGVPAAAPGGPTSVPSFEEMLAGLDSAAGGRWNGDRANRQTVYREWWNANPSRRNQPMPAWS